jgi:hypothetical protein
VDETEKDACLLLLKVLDLLANGFCRVVAEEVARLLVPHVVGLGNGIPVLEIKAGHRKLERSEKRRSLITATRTAKKQKAGNKKYLVVLAAVQLNEMLVIKDVVLGVRF